MADATFPKLLLRGIALYLLALETSNRQPTAALFCDAQHVQVTAIPLDQSPGSALFPIQIQEMLENQGLTPAKLDAIAVSMGPGSFTGLRIGIVLAKTWAWATGCPLIAVDTFESLALAAIQQDQIANETLVHVVVDAQRNQVFLGSYRRTEVEVLATGEIRIIDINGLATQFGPDSWIVGPAISKKTLQDQIQRAPKTQSRLITPNAKLVGDVAWKMFQAKLFSDPFKLVPKYVRPSAAEEKLAAPINR